MKAVSAQQVETCRDRFPRIDTGAVVCERKRADPVRDIDGGLVAVAARDCQRARPELAVV